MNLAGPRSREVLASSPTSTARPRASSTSTPSTPTVAGVPCLLLRIGFVGELGYEIHCPAAHGRARVGRDPARGIGGGAAAVRAGAAARAAAAEAARHRRPGHRLGVDAVRRRRWTGSSSSTRSRTSSAAGRSRTSRTRTRDARSSASRRRAASCRPRARSCSPRTARRPARSPARGARPSWARSIGMATVPAELAARRRADLDLRRRPHDRGDRHDQAVLRPRGRGAALVSLDFLAPARGASAPAALSPLDAATTAAGAAFEVRDGWRVPRASATRLPRRVRSRRGGLGRRLAPGASSSSRRRRRRRRAGRPRRWLELGRAVPDGGAWWCRVTPVRALVIGGPRARRVGRRCARST